LSRKRTEEETITSFDPASHLRMLREISARVAAGDRLEDVLTTVTSVLVEGADFRSVAIWLYLRDEECEHCRQAPVSQRVAERRLHRVTRTASTRLSEQDLLHTLPLSDEFAARLARDPAPICENDVMGLARLVSLLSEGRVDLPKVQAMAGSAEREGLRGGAVFPLFVGENFTGFLFMLSGHEIDPEEVRYLEVFALQTASIIRWSKAYGVIERLRDQLAQENTYLEETVRQEAGFTGIVGTCEPLRQTLRLIEQVAPTDSTVLLVGETGTGKELFARAIHDASRRAGHPMIKVNCGGFAPGLVDSELFGHERGAFTGATQRRIGRFELADRGTLFLDEVAELPPETQVKLLRVLQEREFERVGGERTISVDVRLIAATHRDLELEVSRDRFRTDLYYRLNVLPVRVPPLRERREDIESLARHFVTHFGRRMGKKFSGLSRASVARLQRYDWPGNIRELQNVIERSCVLAKGPVVEVPDPAPGPNPGRPWQAVTLEEAEQAHIGRTLERTDWRIEGAGGAAQLLGLRPSTLRSRIKKLGLRRPAEVS
jgi:formate hydrogenlyase transcriptional activator